ncbi:MAG: hypothetical protein FD123_2132 [Bacteroidetes bacterium]|nr:MAG: hypothetical protein FD123_2132 [Bacteroidota bacterium]
MEYNFSEIEKKWQKAWKDNQTYRVTDGGSKPKYYVLDMFPYPSGAGLHVGHPLGYIASDIFSRYKRLKGFNVLHPMGFDAFGLPAEQYAIQTGRHPADTTKENIARYREQLDKIGFSFDWSREVRTCEPEYYRWTQWVFLQLFKSWYNCKTQKAESLDTLIAVFEKEGFKGEAHQVLTGDIEHDLAPFTAEEWKNFSEKEKSDVLMNFRLAYLGEAWVNWCPGLGTVLANDEVKDGVSERGGYPVERKRMPQWSLRITAYADRLLNDLNGIDWSDSIKEAQRNWIGRSEGTSIFFRLENHDAAVEVFTTRPDTVFGVSFVTLAPEHELVAKITTAEYKAAVDAYVNTAKNKSERERQADVKNVSGQFTGAYVIHPFTAKKVPVWIGEYVLAGYGTGAVMAVPAHDSRDFAFASHFGLEKPQVIQPPAAWNFEKESFDEKEGVCINSDFLDGLEVKAAIRKAIEEIEKRGLGKGKINFRLRDAAFGRQRYWGEPIPIYYKPAVSSSAVENTADLIPVPLDESELPLILPEVDKFLPTETGEPPLARARGWAYRPHPLPLSEGGGSDAFTFGEGYTPRFFTTSPEKWKLLKEWARAHRKAATPAEDLLWQELRGKKTGFQIRRQHAIDVFIVDFVCLSRKLVIEVDGGYHNDPGQQEYDAQRTLVLNELGFKVMRFTNEQVLQRTSETVNEIANTLRTTVLPEGEERGGVAYPYETTTMPGWAGSSWYFLRYMDPHNENEFVSREKADYWQNVDLYLGGAEHATGHLLYVRFWTKFLYDIGKIGVQEPAKKLINQGMIQGMSEKIKIKQSIFSGTTTTSDAHPVASSKSFLMPQEMEGLNSTTVTLPIDSKQVFVSAEIEDSKDELMTFFNYVPIQLSKNSKLEIDKYLEWNHKERNNDISSAVFLIKNFYWFKGNWYDYSMNVISNTSNLAFLTKSEVEKMSKSKLNVETPDDICDQYGADTLRMYEMFLGPIDQAKPWNTNGITGVHGFLRRFWRLFHDDKNGFAVNEEAATKAELKVLHKTIKKIGEDVERFSFNTGVSSFMIACNELTELKCRKRSILEPLVIALSPFAPHIAEELWEKLGHTGSVNFAQFPVYDEQYLTEDSFEYPVQVNGKLRFKYSVALGLNPQQIEKEVMGSEEVQKWLDGKTPKKVIVVPNKIVNIVV